jgi:hypothetical protein
MLPSLSESLAIPPRSIRSSRGCLPADGRLDRELGGACVSPTILCRALLSKSSETSKRTSRAFRDGSILPVARNLSPPDPKKLIPRSER